MDSDESYHSESDFFIPPERTNDNDKENIGAASNEELQLYVYYQALPCFSPAQAGPYWKKLALGLE